MLIKKLELLNFRNYGFLELSFHPQNNIITGGNAQGKSNLIEAIYYLSHMKSKRTTALNNIMMDGSDKMSVYGEIEDGERVARIRLRVDRGVRTLEVNGRKTATTSVLGFLLKTVLFSPEDLELLKGGPSFKREYLDETAVEVSPGHQDTLNRYKHIVRQRNAILKEWERHGKRLHEVLEPWDNALVDYGTKILTARLDLLECVGKKIEEYYSLISGLTQEIDINYSPTFNVDGPMDEVRERMREALHENRDEEKRLRMTVVGAHRDGVEIKIRGMDARFCASQGEQRTLAFCLRLSQRDCIVEKTGSVPVLLLDDVLSELDEKRRKNVVECAEGRGQLFISATGDGGEGTVGEGEYYVVKSGEIEIGRA
ncbi:MAG: DNA replication/repair protein RecF [Actinobacteria bacterium]|nr:DNA replication/repair protein RecF [Actinomycetota bacterium]